MPHFTTLQQGWSEIRSVSWWYVQCFYILRKLDQLSLLLKILSWLLIPSKIKSRIPKETWKVLACCLSCLFSLPLWPPVPPQAKGGPVPSLPAAPPQLHSFRKPPPDTLASLEGLSYAPLRSLFPFLNLACILYSTFFFFQDTQFLEQF